MSFQKVLSALIAGLISRLPFSLISKLADGKISKEEFSALKEEIIETVILVMNDLAVKNNIPNDSQVK